MGVVQAIFKEGENAKKRDVSKIPTLAEAKKLKRGATTFFPHGFGLY